MQSRAPLRLILSPLRTGRGELERLRLGSLFADLDTVPLKVPLSLSKRERVRVRVRLDCMETGGCPIRSGCHPPPAVSVLRDNRDLARMLKPPLLPLRPSAAT